jgi:hypothetical protein
MPDEPDVSQIPVELTPQRVYCPGHGEHFRANWPTGFLTFGIHAFQKATENPKLWDACRKAADLSAIEQIPPTVINLVTEHTPLCYFLKRSDIITMLRDAGTLEGAAWLRIARCDLCGIPRFAGPYSIDNVGRIQTLTVCLECACDAGERIHRVHPTGGVWPNT